MSTKRQTFEMSLAGPGGALEAVPGLLPLLSLVISISWPSVISSSSLSEAKGLPGLSVASDHVNVLLVLISILLLLLRVSQTPAAVQCRDERLLLNRQ
jgi:hypothetical protein